MIIEFSIFSIEFANKLLNFEDNTMSIKSRKISSSFLIGLFVLVGGIILVGFLIWMGATQFLKEQKFYVTYFDGSVEGLEPGSAVKYLGVPCGRVRKVQVAEDGRLVEVIIYVDDKIAINDSMRIKAELAGIAGGKFLQIFIPIDTTMASMHPKLNFDAPYPVIFSAPSGIEEMTIALREVMDNMMKFRVQEISDATINFLNATTTFFDDKELHSLINNLAASSTNLNSILSKANESPILENLTQTSESMLNASIELKGFADNLNQELKDMNFKELSSNIYTDYKKLIENTNKSVSNVSFRLETVIFGLNETFDELRTTNRAMQRSLRAVSDNPSQIFLSEPPPKEK